MSRRDDFTKKTVELLARRSGGRCSMCGCSTWGPNDKPYSYTNIGKAAHITAAAEGGPRYDCSMDSETRSSLKNAIWLCSNCHDKVDRNPVEYSVKYLKKLKTDGEERAKREIGVAFMGKTESGSGDKDPISMGVSAGAILEIRKLKAQLATYHVRQPTLTDLKSLLVQLDFIDFNDPFYLPSVAMEMVSFLNVFVGYHDDPSLKLEVIRYLSDISNHFQSSDLDVKEICSMLETIATGHSPRQPVYQSALALLKDLSLKVPKSDAALIKNAMATVAKQRGGRLAMGRRGMEGIDYAGEDDEEEEEENGEPLYKRARLGNKGGESNDEIYLEKMATLAELQSQEEREEIEREIVKLGFEANIL